MRLFVAIELPERIKEYLRKIQAALPENNGVSMRKTSDFHLTLKFLGSVDGNKRKEVEKILEQVSFQKFEAELAHIGIFGFRGMPRVVWVGIKVPQWLFETQKRMEDLLEPLGFEKENRFSPHLTLARIKSVKNPKAFEDAVKKINIQTEKFGVDGFCLFESHLSPKGATYEILRKFNA